MLAVISFIWQILSTHSALGSEPGPDIPRSPSHYLPETLIIIMLFQQMSPFQWKFPSHSLSADWVVPTSDLQLPPLLTFVCFCSICSQVFHLRGPMQAHPGCVCPSIPCGECPGSVRESHKELPAPSDGCWLKGARFLPLCTRNHALCRPPFDPHIHSMR